MTEDGLRQLFRELREEPLPADSLARVRLRIAERRHARRRWQIAAWVLAPLCALALAIVWRPAAPPVARPAPQEQARSEPAVAPRIEPAIVHSKPHRRVRRKQVALHSTDTPPLIRIETADPEVVILLVGN